ncbi:MAG: rubrerythrin family protein [Synergistales bacterium]|nr:rubrerythrin family protein [Synergistales bacterium]
MGSKTQKNLAEGFAGESQANRKYIAYAQKAEAEGKTKVAKLFRTAAEAETIHALAHFKAMGMVKTTAENLEDAIAGETYEYSEMYPDFLNDANEEGDNAQARRSFQLAREAEKVHAELYRKALEDVESGASGEAADYYLCPVCGHISEGKPEERCPICGAKPEQYTVVA